MKKRRASQALFLRRHAAARAAEAGENVPQSHGAPGQVPGAVSTLVECPSTHSEYPTGPWQKIFKSAQVLVPTVSTPEWLRISTEHASFRALLQGPLLTTHIYTRGTYGTSTCGQRLGSAAHSHWPTSVTMQRSVRGNLKWEWGLSVSAAKWERVTWERGRVGAELSRSRAAKWEQS
jgi:hypothetical protein